MEVVILDSFFYTSPGRVDEVNVPITIQNADLMDTKEGCLVVLEFQCAGKSHKKTFRCASDVRFAIKAAVQYEMEVRDKNAMRRDRISKPVFETIGGECYAVCRYKSRRGRTERMAKLKVGSQDPDKVLRKVTELARQMALVYRQTRS